MKLDPKTYASRTFNFDARRQELEKQSKDAERAAIVKETEERVNRQWSERTGSNPDLRAPQENIRYAEIQRAVKTGSRPDPLSMNEVERRNATRSAIRTELAEAER